MKKITSTVTELEYKGMRLFAAHTEAKDVVSIEGSVLGGWNMLPRLKQEIPGLAAELLDAGTTKRDKSVIRESLAAHGASLSFAAGGDRMYFSGSSLPEDVPFLLKIIVECLSEASFPVTEIKTARERALAELEDEKNQTRPVAANTLSRLIYDPSHANYAEPLAGRRKNIESVSRSELVTFRKRLGQGGLILAIVGDITVPAVLEHSKHILAKLPRGTVAAPIKTPNKKAQTESTKLIPIKDKANIDVYLGAAVPLTYDDKAYLPFMILNQMLGGHGFTSHLMATIRERDGLTYGVYTTSGGFGGRTHGSFQVWATFSPQKYTESVQALKKEITIFFKEQFTKEKLEARKLEMAGSYTVGLSTTRGLAHMLHKVGIEEKPLSYLDEYVNQIKAVSIEDLREAAALIPLDKLSLAAAGTFVE